MPQLSAKREGLEADGIVHADEDIASHYRALTARYPDEFAGFREGGFYVVVMPLQFSTPEQALTWCAAEGFGRDDCLAKLLLTTGSPEGTTRYLEE